MALSFDLNRAMLNQADFMPFVVTETTPLSQVMSSNQVKMDTPLMVSPKHEPPLAVLLSQMAYHHVAQGDIGGEPWLFSF